MGWFVNGKDGSVFYLQGVHKLTNELGKAYELGDVKNYKRLGNDDMLGKNNPEINSWNSVKFSPGQARLIMDVYGGYKQGERLTVQEMKTVSAESGESGKLNRLTHYSKPTIESAEITYVKPTEFNKNTEIKQRKVGDIYFQMNEIETTTYKTVVPMGERSTIQSSYKEQKKTDNVNTTLDIIASFISIFF